MNGVNSKLLRPMMIGYENEVNDEGGIDLGLACVRFGGKQKEREKAKQEIKNRTDNLDSYQKNA